MNPLVPALAVGCGAALLTVGWLARASQRLADLASVLELPGADLQVRPDLDRGSHAGLLRWVAGGVDNALERADVATRIRMQMERARVPLRPGELMLALAAVSSVGMVLVWFVTGQLLLALVALAALPSLGWHLAVARRAQRRRRAAEEQLPDALTLIAGSLQAGHTFLRAIEMLVEEADPPLSEEFERVTAETRLGDPLVDALSRMASRLEIDDLTWVVQAIRIQQTVGGKLADLLSTLAEFMRARQEIRREVRVLTAEGRLSAYVLGGLPAFMVLAIQVLNPGYLTPMLQGWGIAAMAGAAASIVFGVTMILRMARVEV